MIELGYQGLEVVPAWPISDDPGSIASPCACGCVHYGHYPDRLAGSIQIVARYCDGHMIALVQTEPNEPVRFDDMWDAATAMRRDKSRTP